MSDNKLREFVPKAGERVMLAGQTGSGKTTLARYLLEWRKHVVVLDVKGTINWKGYTLHKDFSTLTKDTKHQRLIYRPDPLLADDLDELDVFFRWVYIRRNCTVYVDELMGVTRGELCPPYLKAILTRGRELGVEMWTATQRPKGVPQVTMSEAEHFYCFRLRMPQDRERVEQLTGVRQEQIAALPKFDFIYARQDADVPDRAYRLKL